MGTEIKFTGPFCLNYQGSISYGPYEKTIKSIYLISLLISGFGFRFTNVGRFCKARSGD